MPYDAERVAQAGLMLRDARKRTLSQGLAAARSQRAASKWLSVDFR
jgi:hypothetical protein